MTARVFLFALLSSNCGSGGNRVRPKQLIRKSFFEDQEKAAELQQMNSQSDFGTEKPSRLRTLGVLGLGLAHLGTVDALKNPGGSSFGVGRVVPTGGTHATGPWVIGVSGAPCSGKSSLASRLFSELAGENKQALSQDHFYKWDMFESDDRSPLKEINGHVWKDFESVEGMDFAAMIKRITEIKASMKKNEFLVVEGFMLFATPESRALFDAAINIEVDEKAALSRRLSRAKNMSGLPKGIGTHTNYEVLSVYTRDDPHRREILNDARERHPHDSEHGWLRMYFDEVIWPAAAEQSRVVASQLTVPMMSIKSCDSESLESWLAGAIPPIIRFVKGRSQAVGWSARYQDYITMLPGASKARAWRRAQRRQRILAGAGQEQQSGAAHQSPDVELPQMSGMTQT